MTVLDSQLIVTPVLAAFSQKGIMVMSAENELIRWCDLAVAEKGSHVIAAEAVPVHEHTFETNLLNLLIVEDERSVRECCREVARSLGFNTQVAESRDEAYRILGNANADVVLLDLRLPGSNGLEVLREIKRQRPEAVVIVMTGFATVQSAVQAMKLGAYDYITKPFNFDELRLELERVAGHLEADSGEPPVATLKSKHGFGQMVGHSPEMEKLYRIIAKAAHSTHPVLILGESGTGKELVARSIHYSGPFKDKPFIPVDCGSLVPHPDRKRTVRLRARRFHRGGAGQGRLAGDRRRRNDFSRRDWRVAGGPASQVAAGHPGEGNSTGGQHPRRTHRMCGFWLPPIAILTPL